MIGVTCRNVDMKHRKHTHLSQSCFAETYNNLLFWQLACTTCSSKETSLTTLLASWPQSVMVVIQDGKIYAKPAWCLPLKSSTNVEWLKCRRLHLKPTLMLCENETLGRRSNRSQGRRDLTIDQFSSSCPVSKPNIRSSGL